jgi:dihydrodipicolinate reductase
MLTCAHGTLTLCIFAEKINTNMTRIAISGAAGRMGRHLIEACHLAPVVELSVALEHPDSPLLGADAWAWRSARISAP